MQIAILGRQSALSLAELECLFGADKINPISDLAALIDTRDPLSQPRLGGTLKSGKLLTRLENTDIEGAFNYLAKTIPEHLQYLPEGKLQLGVSCYGFDVKPSWLLKRMLELKKVVKGAGRSVRIIENKSPALESAVVLYNKLTDKLGWEFLLVKDGNDVLLAQTTGVQNVDDYSKRDFDRPKRDAYVGMLPPKLAQIMINLVSPRDGATVLDPFCGTGVVLQEAQIMGYDVYGTDKEPRMVEYSLINLRWLTETGLHTPPPRGFRVETADATNYQWPHHFDTVVTETYLGKPMTSLPTGPDLHKITTEADHIASQFLKNICNQVKSGTRFCLALPAWHLGNEKFKHLPLLDHLTDLGYNRLDLKHASKDQLIYHRPDQIVARELTILEKV
jgi:tRNA G10  N-methylase Trm11